MPPALRNQRAPTAGDTPAPTAASSLERPAAINTQNWCRSSRRATEGRPGEGNAPRPDRSERRFRTAITTSSLKVLRRPLEPGLSGCVAHRERASAVDAEGCRVEPCALYCPLTLLCEHPSAVCPTNTTAHQPLGC